MEATSILAGFHAFLYPGQINLEFRDTAFCEGRKSGEPKTNSTH